jgi:hypothetical protein
MRTARRWLVAGSALAAIVGGSAVAWSVIAADPDDTDPAPSVIRVLTAGDAEAASASISRRIRRELAGDVRIVGVPWASGAEARLVIGARRYPTSVEAVDRRTGERTPLPTLWKGHSVSVSPVRLTQRAVWVSWVHHVDGVERPAAMRYVVGTGQHELVLAPEVPHHSRANFTSALAMGDDGRFYFRTFRTGHDGPAKFTQLWSFDPASLDDPRREGEAQHWTVAGSLLATLAYDNQRDPVILRVRDLTTGEEHHHTFEACDEPHLEASNAFVVVACRDESEILVLDRTATPLVRLRVPQGVNVSGFGPPSLHVGNRWLSVGRLAYRPSTGRLLRLHP